MFCAPDEEDFAGSPDGALAAGRAGGAVLGGRDRRRPPAGGRNGPDS